MSDAINSWSNERERVLLLETFREEAAEIFEALEERLMEIEKIGVSTPDDVDTVFRHFHTLKGSAACVGLHRAGAFVHRVEDRLAELRADAGAIAPALATLLLQAVDVTRRLCRETTGGETELTNDEIQLLEQFVPGGQANDAAPANSPTEPRTRPRQIRVEVAKLDKLMAIASEVAVMRARLDEMILDPARSRELVAQIHRDGDAMFEELQELATTLRTIPAEPLFRKYGRAVRDMARVSEKQVNFIVDAEDVAMDLLIAERLSEPLTHLLRNAVDHGIESARERVRAGKPANGNVWLRARRASGHVVIEVEDDGGGIDRARVREKAAALRLIRESDSLTDEEILALVFHPGFTTATATTSLSGRGVGMDAVKRSIEAMRGRITIRSTPGSGACVIMRLPLTLSVLRAFQVSAAGETFLIPIADVERCFPAPSAAAAQYAGTIDHEGSLLSFVNLGHFVARRLTPALRPHSVVVSSGTSRLALVVDDILGETRAVVRPMGRIVSRLAGVGGAAIVGSGNVALVIDVPTLLSDCERRYRVAS